jgi:hypothetical protein
MRPISEGPGFSRTPPVVDDVAPLADGDVLIRLAVRAAGHFTRRVGKICAQLTQALRAVPGLGVKPVHGIVELDVVGGDPRCEAHRDIRAPPLSARANFPATARACSICSAVASSPQTAGSDVAASW